MYKSPIEILSQGLQLEIENGVYKAIENYGIHVDKDELIRALRYDRNQYDKGFADGVAFITGRIGEVINDAEL